MFGYNASSPGLMYRIYAQHAHKFSDVDTLLRDFNADSINKMYCALEEPRAGCGKRNTDKLKDLITEGQPNPEALRALPQTMELLRQAAGETAPQARPLSFSFINARISTLLPGTHISAHCGMSNAKLRAHLGLRVPTVAAPSTLSHIRVAEEVRRWREGEWLIFDDSFEHEVWWQWQHQRAENDKQGAAAHSDGASSADTGGSGERVVLILDFFHPGLPEARRQQIHADLASRAAGTAGAAR